MKYLTLFILVTTTIFSLHIPAYSQEENTKAQMTAHVPVRAITSGPEAHWFGYYDKYQFDILVVQNALAIPVNIPLGLALTEFIIESGIPTIAHHHDFYWERQRFHSFAAMDYLKAAFPLRRSA